MHIFDTQWITHEGGSIFSLDFHPNGNKLATAGQDSTGAGLLIVWDVEFLCNTTDLSINSFDSQCNCGPLARVPHTILGSINCVRWSKHSGGKRLVCAGDDSVICIYECVGVYSSMGSFNQQHTLDPKRLRRNVESYRCTHKLYGHSIDVTHIDWSPDGKFLASCSLDNTIIVWNVLKLPEKITVLKQSDGGHTRGVKGLAWDPVGRFLATQSEDNTLKIWQTDSWTCVRTFSEPFQESPNSTHFCRMDWSPEGSYLVAPCAMNNGGPTAKIIIRKDWSHLRDLVGFRKAVSCVRAHTMCFQRTNDAGTHTTATCFAIGSRDRSLSVWLIPNFGRPLLVIEKIFKLSVLDMSWNGLMLAACSVDGTVKLLKFSEGEIGHLLSSHQTGLIMERIYGLQPQFLLPTEPHKCVGGNSVDFGYVSICDEFSKRAMETTISPNELNKLAFNRELSNTKVRKELLQQFVLKSKKLMRHFNSLESKKGIMRTPIEQQQQGIMNRTDGRRLYERRKEEPTSDSLLFELPDLKRLIFVEIVSDQKATSTSYVEVVNDCFEMGGDFFVSRIAAYRCNINSNDKYWEFFVPRSISLLAANSNWTIFSSFDAHFFVLSTLTGRLLFQICLGESIAVLELEQKLCLTIGIAGTLLIWDILDGSILARLSINELLYGYPIRQLITSSLCSVQSDEKCKRASFFAGLLFSDLDSFVCSPKLQGWTKGRTIKDFLDGDQIPTHISSMLLQNGASNQSL